jgi:hypothetical protein
MKFRFQILAVAILAVCAVTPALAGKDDKAGDSSRLIARRVAICNSAGVVGVQDLTPFLNVPTPIEMADTTGRDSLITSTAVWINRSLYRLNKDHESRIDVEGPTDLTVVTMAPFHEDNTGFKMDYTMSVRIENGGSQEIDLHTQRSSPLYTTRNTGMAFGQPKAFLVSIPGGRHSVYFKVIDGPVTFVYGIFHVTSIPPEELRK